MMLSFLKIAAVVVLPALAVLFYRTIVLPPQQWAKHTSGGLLGEVHIKDSKDAHKLADDSKAEAFLMWEEPSSNWELMHNETYLRVEVRRITEGPFNTSGLLLSRSEGIVNNVTPDELYRFLTTPIGLQLLDPNLDLDEAAKYIERYDWEGHGKDARLDVHESFNRVVLPGMSERYYIVLNGYDYHQRFFFCKSIIHDSKPGSSPYYEGSPMPTTDPRVRALNTFYFQMMDAPSGQGTLVRMVNYADLRIGSTMINWMTAKVFYPDLYSKLNAKWSDDSSNHDGFVGSS